MKNWTNNQLAFVIARITIGINFLIHGVVRIPKLQAFAEGMTKGFEQTYLPEFLVMPFATALPFLELVLGLFLLIGFKMRLTAAVSALLIAVLVFGAAMKEDWPLVGSLTIYTIFFFLLIKNLEHNVFAVDGQSKTKVDGFKIER